MLPTWNPWRISAVAGVLFVVVSLAAAAFGAQPPAYDEAGAQSVAWFEENGERMRLGHVVAGLAFLLFYFPFFAGFCERLRLAEGDPAIWTRVTWAGAIISPAAGTTSGTFNVGVALLARDAASDVATFGASGSFYAYLVAGAFGGVAMLGAAMVILQTGVFPRWLGWCGAIIGLAAVLSTFSLVENDPAGMFATLNGVAWLAYFLWIGAIAVALFRTAPSPGTSVPRSVTAD